MNTTAGSIMSQLRDIEARSAVLAEELRASRPRFDQAIAQLKAERRLRALKADAERWLVAPP